MIRIAIIEDDPSEAKQLQTCLQQYEKENSHVFHIKQFRTTNAFEEMFNCQFDLIFLDIELPDGNGMELARQIRKSDASVTLIFVTHLAQYAISGYEVNALDYILKPVEYASFRLKMQRAVIHCKRRQTNFLTINVGSNTIRVDENELAYIEIYKHHIRYHLQDRVVESYGTLSKVEEGLPQKGFYRCSNSFIINLRFINRVDNAYVYIGDEQIPISRGKKKELISEYHRFFGDLDEK